MIMATQATNKTSLARIAATSLLLSMSLAACNKSTTQARPAYSSDATKAGRTAATAANKAEKALAKQNFALAVTEAELAVAAMPRDAGYRTLLGRAYLAAGRFASAETTFSDALALDPQQGRAALSLALAQIALGRTDAARDAITTYQTIISPADRGLALALAGDPDSAIALLEATVRASQSDARVRQNLALSYALAGRWQDAKLMASYDVAPDMLSKRIMDWAQFARPNSASDQVASLLGVTPVFDPGQPTRLALVPTSPEPQALAIVEPAPEVVEAETAPVAIAAVEPEPVRQAPVDFPIEFATFSGVQFGPRAEIVQPLPVSYAKVARTAPVAAKKPAVVAAAPRPALRGAYVVQIGAYANAQQVEDAWSRAAKRFAALGRFEPTTSIFQPRAGAARYHRLAIGGFGTAQEAASLCRDLKAQGGQCFVRTTAGDAPLQWASRANTQVASR
jgi:Flp pilus assembly protein TadD